MALSRLYEPGDSLRCVDPISPLQLGKVYKVIGERPFIHALTMVAVSCDGEPVDRGRPFFKWRFNRILGVER